jgi:phosphoribosyl 1,2-cyclic phosphodiesterase
MRLTMRGCRGSIASPGPDTVKYGGNTTCLQVETAAGETLIIDAGTGIRQLGLELMARAPVRCAIFITHTHWDHIQGLPFFTPLFVPGSEVRICGSFDPVYQKSLAEILAQQMQYCFFPVSDTELKGNISYETLREDQVVQVGSATVRNIVMSHPVFDYGYRIDADGRSLFFTGDYEPPANIFAADDEEYEDYAASIAEQRAALLAFLRGVDTLVIDAQYTEAEYRAGRIGWGHGTYDSGIALAEEAGIPRVVLTHHDPTRSDAALDAIHAQLLASRSGRGSPEVIMAYEGLRLEI